MNYLIATLAVFAFFAVLLVLGVVLADRPRPDEPVGRHHDDTVEIVPQNWTPDIGARLIARETNTQRIDPRDLEQP